MNILFVTHHRRFKTFARSAAWARELVSRGHAVTLLCLSDRRRLAWRVATGDGVTYAETPDLLFGSLRSGWDPVSAFRRWLFLRGRDFELVHAFETRPATIHPLLAWRRAHRTPLIIDWNDWWGRGGLIVEQRPVLYRLLFGRVETWYEEHYRPRADATTVISRELGERAETLGVDRDTIYRIPGGVAVDRVQPLDPAPCRVALGIPADRFVVVLTALDVTGDAGLVFEAIRRVVRQHPDVLLVMSGHRGPSLEHQARRLGLEANFRHVGYLPADALPGVLGCADVFALPLADSPANRGRWPHKMGDYLAAGRPTVANPVGEIGRLFASDAVGLTAGFDPDDFADKLCRLKRDPALRTTLGATARRVAVDRFAWPVIVDRLEACYAATLARKATASAPRRHLAATTDAC